MESSNTSSMVSFAFKSSSPDSSCFSEVLVSSSDAVESSEFTGIFSSAVTGISVDSSVLSGFSVWSTFSGFSVDSEIVNKNYLSKHESWEQNRPMKYKILSKDKRTIMSVFFKMSNGKKISWHTFSIFTQLYISVRVLPSNI